MTKDILYIVQELRVVETLVLREEVCKALMRGRRGAQALLIGRGEGKRVSTSCQEFSRSYPLRDPSETA